MISDLYLLRGLRRDRVARNLRNHEVSVWAVGRGTDRAVAVQYMGNRWRGQDDLRQDVIRMADDYNLSLNVNMEKVR